MSCISHGAHNVALHPETFWNATACCWAKPSVIAKLNFLARPPPSLSACPPPLRWGRGLQSGKRTGDERTGIQSQSHLFPCSCREARVLRLRVGRAGSGPGPSAPFPTQVQGHQPLPSLAERFLSGGQPLLKRKRRVGTIPGFCRLVQGGKHPASVKIPTCRSRPVCFSSGVESHHQGA